MRENQTKLEAYRASKKLLEKDVEKINSDQRENDAELERTRAKLAEQLEDHNRRELAMNSVKDEAFITKNISCFISQGS